MKLSCKCFNITLSIYDERVQPIELKNINVFGVESKDDFFLHGVSPISLTPNGIKEVIPQLIRKYEVGQWEIVACMNCNIPVYAVSAYQSIDKQLVVACNLFQQEDGNHNATIDNYSPAFRILVDGSQDITSSATSSSTADTIYSVEIPKHSTLQPALTLLNDYMSEYVKEQTDIMDDRIKAFISQEQSKLQCLKVRAQRDKMLLVRKLRALEEEYGAGAEQGRITSSTSDLLEISEVLVASSGATSRAHSGTGGTLSAGSSINMSTSSSAYDDTPPPPVFDMDDDDVTATGIGAGPHNLLLYNPPVVPGDSSSGSDADDSEDEDNTVPELGGSTIPGSAGREDRSKLAKSLPVNVPTGHWMRRGWRDLSSEEESPVRAPPHQPQRTREEDIGASIQAIAQSLHHDDDEGAVPRYPRPRLHTTTGAARGGGHVTRVTASAKHQL